MKADVEAERVIWDETIPGGGYWTRVLRRGTTLRLVDLEGSQGVAALFYNADMPSERYNAADTVKIQNTIFPSKGRVLFSDLGRVLLSITEDTCGSHDTLGGMSTALSNEARYGSGRYQDLQNACFKDARANFQAALGRHGMDRRDIMPPINLFARVAVESDGRLRWVAGAAKPASFVDLRAEMNVLVALSNTPHPLSPEPKYDPKPVRAIVWQPPPPAADDLCRNFSPEAVRGFRNTDELFL
jgi:urea carboxylase-associated protein 2